MNIDEPDILDQFLECNCFDYHYKYYVLLKKDIQDILFRLWHLNIILSLVSESLKINRYEFAKWLSKTNRVVHPTLNVRRSVK